MRACVYLCSDYVRPLRAACWGGLQTTRNGIQLHSYDLAMLQTLYQVENQLVDVNRYVLAIVLSELK
jgi:hypothetical protein